MKKILLILLAVLPYFLNAQNNCNFFENVEITIDTTQINTSESDFGPSFVGDELWFSAYTEEEISKLAKGKSKGVFYNIYVSPTDNNGNLLNGKTVKQLAVSENYHAGPVSYCPKTKELFVTVSNFENPIIRNNVYRKADVQLKIIVLKNVNGEWQASGDFPFNSPEYSVGHPTVSVTGDTLFFTSNMPGAGGLGETDIYMTVRNNNTWGKPVNLGNKINTASNEMFPVIFRDMLIFSSNGLGDGEDLDFYYTCYGKNGFSTPQALNELNSDSDDFGLTVHQNQEVGYFTSNKTEGKGNDDIYKIEIEGQYDLELIVMDQETLIPIPNANVSFDDGKNGTVEGHIIKRELKNKSTYIATSDVEGYVNYPKTITTIGKPFGTIKDTMFLGKIEVGNTFAMENIFYDFDKWEILPESEMELNKLVKLMKEYPEWKIELGSHTDSRGSDFYNDILSQKRSDSAVGYIVSAGIAKDRIVAKGYGETMLVNKCDDGVKCSPAQHRANRRTEFKLLDME